MLLPCSRGPIRHAPPGEVNCRAIGAARLQLLTNRARLAGGVERPGLETQILSLAGNVGFAQSGVQ